MSTCRLGAGSTRSRGSSGGRREFRRWRSPQLPIESSYSRSCVPAREASSSAPCTPRVSPGSCGVRRRARSRYRVTCSGMCWTSSPRVERRVDANVALSPLSMREREVLALIGRGSTQSRDCGDPLDLRAHGQAPRAQHARKAPGSDPSGCCEPCRRGRATAPGGVRVARGCRASSTTRREGARPRGTRATGDDVRDAEQDTVGGATPRGARVPVGRTRTTPELTVVAPTRNEQAVIGSFIESLDEALSGVHAELIVVDDSDDATPRVVAERGSGRALEVALIHREQGERDGGLGGAVVAGIAAARAPWVCVMDADLQHPPATIAALRERADAAKSDLVVASRFRTGGSIAGLSAVRTFISRLLVLLARLAFPSRLHGVTDPLTGFFLVRRDALDLAILRPTASRSCSRSSSARRSSRSRGDSLRLRRAAGRREQGLRTGGRALSRAGRAPPRSARWARASAASAWSG